eukprot:GHVU01119504.1.p1 GENE.GHVU01119504.1~~GHVU01119504.1.p1  ORF type:complete len:349 (-),score=5.21 GHVU01119504.1:17-1015(-)
MNTEATSASLGPIWIPQQATEVILRLLVIAHSRDGLHASQQGTWALLSPNYRWKGMFEDVKQFVSECLHCLRGRSANNVSRPLGETLTATHPNEVIHLDYLTVCPSTLGYTYILVVKDNYTRFAWLRPAAAATAQFAAQILHEWCRVYSFPKWLVSDGGSHFKNNLMEHLSKLYGISHHITLARCPWSNGSVENMCGYALRVIRTLRSAGTIASDADWPEALPLIERRINDIPTRHRDIPPRVVFLNQATGRSTALQDAQPPTIIDSIDPTEVNDRLDKSWIDFVEALDYIHQWKVRTQADHLARIRTPPCRAVNRSRAFFVRPRIFSLLHI